MPQPACEPSPEPGRPRIAGIGIERVIGEGAAGLVYAGRQLYVGRPIAIKVLMRGETSCDASFFERFHREAQTLAALRHPHIVACYQAGITDAGDAYLAMELIDGPNLHQWLVGHGALAETDALETVRKLAGALDYALGRGVIHRDVKAENILLERSAGGDGAFPFEPKLADLGIALPARRGDPRLTDSTQLLGTPRNMAPEQFSGPEHVDFRADLYALGCVLFQMLTGRHPFAESDPARMVMDKARVRLPDPRTWHAGISPGVEHLLLALLAPDKEERPRSYEEVITSCERLKTTLPGATTRRRAILGAWPALGSVAALLLFLVPRGTDLQDHSGPQRAAVQRPPDGGYASAAVIFEGPAQFLLAPTPSDPFPRWEPSAGPGLWVAAGEGDGVNGIGSGQLVYPAGPGPWCVDGSVALLSEDSKEAGIRIELARGGAVVLALKRLGRLYATLSQVPDAGSPAAGAPRVVRFSGLDKGLLDQVRFRLSVFPDRVEAQLAGQPFAALPIHGSSGRLALFVDHATASFRGLVLRRPSAGSGVEVNQARPTGNGDARSG